MWPTVPDGVAPASYFGCLAMAVFITGVAKAGFGGGVGILAVPLTAAVLPPQVALSTLLPILIIADVFANLHHIRNRAQPYLAWLFIGALAGIAIGTGVLLALRETRNLEPALNLTVGGACLVLVGLQVYRLLGGRVPHLPHHPLAGQGAGLVAGTVSTLAHSAGPVVSIYLLDQRLDKRLLVGTSAVFFLLVNLAKLPTYLWLGWITTGTLSDSLWVLPLIPVGTLAGYWMHKHIAERPFVVVMYSAAAVTAADMIAKALGWYTLRDVWRIWS